MARSGSSLKLTLLACLISGSPAALAQLPTATSEIATVAGWRCGCGRWTCPACQQQQLCDPNLQWGGPSAPAYVPMDSTGQMDSAGPLDSSGQPMAPPVQLPGTSPDLDSRAPLSPDPGASPSPANDFNFSDAAQTPSLAAPAGGPNAASLFASNLGAGGGGGFGSSLSGASTPEMMGDFFGPGGVPSVFDRDSYTYSAVIPSAAYALGRMKMAENNSPIPRDRVFFNYSLFTGVPLAQNPITVNRFSPGFEKTFLDGLASFEVRTPFGTSLDNDVMANGLTSDTEFQFGNLFLALKGVLLQHNNWLLTGGTSVLVPTAQDTRVIDPISNAEFLRIENESTHIMPFLGGAYLPSDLWFAQWMVQCDIDANGNPVTTTNGTQRTHIGTLQDFTLLYTDISLGYWLYKSGYNGRQTITGIAPVAEVHYNRALNDADMVADANNVVSNTLTDFDNVNIQVGLIFNIHNNSRLGLGYATPLGNTHDRVFDNEFRVTFNRYF